MFGIGFSELAIIALVLIVMIRPDDMPAFFRKMGKIYGQIKSAYKEVTAVKDEFLKEMDVAAAVQDAAAAPAKADSAESTQAGTSNAKSEPAQTEPSPSNDASRDTNATAEADDLPPSDPID